MTRKQIQSTSVEDVIEEIRVIRRKLWKQAGNNVANFLQGDQRAKQRKPVKARRKK
jgi:hypothetical protein